MGTSTWEEKKRKVNKKSPVAKVNIQELMESRDGGKIALRGYSYQFLYSCNLILSSMQIQFLLSRELKMSTP